MNKGTCKYIANCSLCKREKAKMQMYPLQMMDMLDWPFDKIALDLITDLSVSMSGNQHILTIIDHLTRWPESFPIPNKKVDTIVHVLINNYLTVHMCPRFILSDNGMEFKKSTNGWCTQTTWHQSYFLTSCHSQSNGKLEVFHKYSKPTLKKLWEWPGQLGSIHQPGTHQVLHNSAPHHR